MTRKESALWVPVDFSTARTVSAAMKAHPMYIIPDDTADKFAALLVALDRAEKNGAQRS